MKPKTQKKNTTQEAKIPDGWEVKKLGEVCEVKSSKRVHKRDWRKEGIPFYRAREIVKLSETGYVNNDLFISEKFFRELIKTNGYPQKNDIVISAVGTLGKMYIVEKGDTFYIKDASVLWFANIINVIPTYLKYFLSSEIGVHQIMHKSMGATVGTLTITRAKEIKILYPKSLDEQKRIVKVLDEVFAKVERAKEIAEENLKNAQELFESYLQNIFEKKGDDWEEKKLGEIGKVSMCKRILKKQTSESGDVPFYKIGTFGKEANAFISNDIYIKYKNKYSFPEKGDILISASGTIGRTVVYDGKPAYFQDSNIVWLSHDKSEVLNEYLKYFYSVCDWGATRGATISRLYNDNLRQIKIPYPKSLDEQKQIVKKLDELQEKTRRLEAILRSKIAELEKLKKSVLEKAFRGEL